MWNIWIHVNRVHLGLNRLPCLWRCTISLLRHFHSPSIFACFCMVTILCLLVVCQTHCISARAQPGSMDAAVAPPSSALLLYALCVEAVAAMVLLLAFIGFLASLCLVVVLGRRYQAIRLLLHIIDALLLAPQVMHLGIGYCCFAMDVKSIW